MLGFAIAAVVIIFIVLMGWVFFDLKKPNYLFLGLIPAPKISNWPLTLGFFAALTGWMVSAWVTLRNSTKQHTFNIWLQTRCSAKYMEHAEIINKLYFNRKDGYVLTIDDLEKPDFKNIEQSFVYVLNHYEFVAVGIRSGDLDEDIIRQAMRGIVVGLYEYASAYIKRMQGQSPQAYEHLTALYHRWKK